MQKSVLGKGLASLLPGAGAPPPAFPGSHKSDTTVVPNNKDRHPGISVVALDVIVSNPYQPRSDFNLEELKELAESIKANGLIQPLVVRKAVNGYELIAGERRLRAAALAGLNQVPVVIRASTDRESMELAIVENVQRSDLNCVEEAAAYMRLSSEFGLTQNEIADRCGKDRSTVSNLVRLLRLPEAIINSLKNEKISLGHAKVLLSLEKAEDQIQFHNRILENELSVRQLEREILSKQEKKESRPLPSGQDTWKHSLVEKMKRALSIKAQVMGSQDRGRVVLHYQTRDDLNKILDRIALEK